MKPIREFIDREFVPFPMNQSYLVADDGTVFSKHSGRFLKPCRLKRGGYLAVSLWQAGRGKTWPVHQLVALTFLGPRPEKHEAAHNDGNKTNNLRNNIRWATHKDNESDKISHGTINRGERNGGCKLTDVQCKTIINQHVSGQTQRYLASEFGVSQSCISMIVTGKRRSH